MLINGFLNSGRSSYRERNRRRFTNFKTSFSSLITLRWLTFIYEAAFPTRLFSFLPIILRVAPIVITRSKYTKPRVLVSKLHYQQIKPKTYLEHTRPTLNDHLLPFKIHSELYSTRVPACIRLYVVVGRNTAQLSTARENLCDK